MIQARANRHPTLRFLPFKNIECSNLAGLVPPEPITDAQIEEITKIKMPDLNCFTLEAAEEQVRGACKSMGGEVPVQ